MRAGGTEEARDGGREGAEAGGEREGAGCGAWALLLRPHAYTRPRTDTDSTCPSPHATCGAKRARIQLAKRQRRLRGFWLLEMMDVRAVIREVDAVRADARCAWAQLSMAVITAAE